MTKTYSVVSNIQSSAVFAATAAVFGRYVALMVETLAFSASQN